MKRYQMRFYLWMCDIEVGQYGYISGKDRAPARMWAKTRYLRHRL
jgi:hypothetical protein